MMRLTIGQVARRAEVGVETVRFYERQGLVPEPPRSASGYRQYPEETIARLRFIQRAKELGFSLKEVEELISLRVDGSACASDVKRKAEEKVRDTDDRMRDLRRVRKSLSQLAAACTGRGSTEECSILGALGKAEP
jgi:MerR family mercuric resistance operon transcriptional regulator